MKFRRLEEYYRYVQREIPLGKFVKKQLQEKDKELKGIYRAIRGAKKESGIGWDESIGMIIAEPEQWLKRQKKYPKIKKCQKKGFPLYGRCEALYEGSIATGDLSFTSIETLQPFHAPTEPVLPMRAPTELVLPLHAPTPNFLSEEQQLTEGMPSASEASGRTIANPFARSVDGEVQSAPSGTSTQSGTGKKRKQS